VCIFFNFDHLRITLQSSDLIWGTKFRAPSLPLNPLIFSYLQACSYGGELVLDSSSPWSGLSNHISSFSISLPLIFKKQRTPLMKNIQGLQAPHGATSLSLAFVTKGKNKAEKETERKLKCRVRSRVYEKREKLCSLLLFILNNLGKIEGCFFCISICNCSALVLLVIMDAKSYRQVYRVMQVIIKH